MAEKITVQTLINAPIEKVWDFYNNPEHITQWNNASPDWHSPRAVNDLKAGGKFSIRMEAKDGSEGFDFEGTYDAVTENESFAYTMSDNREVFVKFTTENNGTRIEVSFDPETENAPEFQKEGWQSILDNFKKYVEGK